MQKTAIDVKKTGETICSAAKSLSYLKALNTHLIGDDLRTLGIPFAEGVAVLAKLGEPGCFLFW